MSHSSLFVSGQLLWLSLEDSFFIFFCRHDSSVDFTRLQYIINNLEEGRRAHLSSNNNVQCSVSDQVGATSSDDSSDRIRTATRDGDRAVGVNLVRLHRTRSASVKMFSQKGIIVIQISIVQINLINMIHCIHNLNWVFIL